MNMRKFFAPSAWRLGGAMRRAATALAVMLMTVTAWAETRRNIAYIDANGNPATCSEATVVTTDMQGGMDSGSNGNFMSGYGWFVVTGDVTLNGAKNPSTGPQNLILCDGATLTINGRMLFTYTSLTIYGQSGGTGKLVVSGSYNGVGILSLPSSKNLIINGGTVEVTNTAWHGPGISCGTLVMNGGNLTATGDQGISGNITISWKNSTDRIKAKSYGGSVTIADGKYMKDSNGNVYRGTLTSDQKSAIADVELQPATKDEFIAAVLPQTADNEYTISTTDGWDVFCDLLADNDKGYFTGKTVKLGADISVSRMAGGQPFTGTFDGDSHTLTLNYGTADAPVDAQFVAPFVETTADGDHQPKFRNLTIDGTIYDNYSGTEEHNVGGLIGHLYGDVTIEHCTSRVHITSVGGAGGFVGLCEHTAMFTDCVSSAVITSPGGNNSGFVSWSRASGHAISFEGCVFNGKLLQQNGEGSHNGGFIGWTGSNKTVTITNCLCNPAATTSGETMATSNSATFARGWNATTTATNSYYTTAFDTAQGEQAYSITAGENVTVANAGNATEYSTSGITTYGTGIKYGEVLYAGNGETVSLTLSNTPPAGYSFSSYAVSPDGTTLTKDGDNYTLTMPDADVTIGATFTEVGDGTEAHPYVIYDWDIFYDWMTNHYDTYKDKHYKLGADVIATTMVGEYSTSSPRPFCGTFDGNGHTLTVKYGRSTSPITVKRCAPFVYVKDATIKNLHVKGNITTAGAYAGGIVGEVYSDGSSLTLENCRSSVTITFTGGSSGSLSAAMIGGLIGACNCKSGKTVTTNISGCVFDGRLIARNGYDVGGFVGFKISRATLNIYNSLFAPQNVIVGNNINGTFCGNIAPTTISNSYYTEMLGTTQGGTKAYALTTAPANLGAAVEGVDYTVLTAYKNGILFNGKYYVAPEAVTLNDNADNDLSGVNGYVADVTLAGRTLYKDGKWNTLCLPFDVTVGSDVMEGATAMTLNGSTSGFNASTGELTLNFDNVAQNSTIDAGTPFIVKWTGEDVTNPVFSGVTVSSTEAGSVLSGDKNVTFQGTYNKLEYTTEDKSILFLGEANTLYWPQPSGEDIPTIGAFRAYFHVDLNGGANAVRSFVLNFGDSSESTGIREIDTDPAPSPSPTGVGRSAAWHTLDGVKLDVKPTKKGLYINNGKKVVIRSAMPLGSSKK